MPLSSAKIMSDEDGLALVIDFQLAPGAIRLRLSAEAAIELLESAMEEIAPWHTIDGESVLIALGRRRDGEQIPWDEANDANRRILARTSPVTEGGAP